MKLIVSYNAYAVPIRVYDSGASADFNRRLISTCCSANMTRAPGIGRVSLQSCGDKQVVDEMTAIYERAFRAYVDELYDKTIYDVFDFRHDMSVNLYRNGGAVVSHSHNEAFVTMTYYPQDCEAEEQSLINRSLVNYKTGQVALQNHLGTGVWDRFSKDYRQHIPVTFKAGTVVVFPGYTPHFTIPGSLGQRICIATFVSAFTKASIPLLT